MSTQTAFSSFDPLATHPFTNNSGLLPKPTAPSHTKSTSSGPKPIFVPFRPERSSPELDDILLKKRVSDVFANKDTWSIDQLEYAPGSSLNARR
ncbi:uncharacterized protein B0H18DRAFT_1094744 [Fomitopsis serialis]|uniref:uncharacterized protein n=1 Tax=Fomitopsis serialis TaxID=139415 RepID=UPI002008BF26|nr:uncharacterized protein B0H18DRAFT_1094744 [Neoantrodia serialis]KAH9926112.1 hypothetical protein B0H18DRAFT_1094744 [Neoantrodia serialis]